MEIKRKVCCIGDSVASPFKMKVRTNTFSDLLARRIGFDCDGPHVLAGGTSGEMLHHLNEDEAIMEDVRNSGIILLVIGSNNITITYLSVMAAAVDIPFSGRMINRIVEALKANPLKAAVMLKAMNSKETKATIQSGVDDFKREMPLVFARIRELNPDAIIVIQTVYSLADTTANPVYKVMSRAQAGYIAQMNEWMYENRKKYGFIISDLEKAMQAYAGEEDLTNVKSNDIHLNDLGHLLAYRTLYAAVTAEYPELSREEGSDVIHERKMKTREERLAREKNDEIMASSSYAGAVKSAIYEILGHDDFEIDMDRQLIEIGMTELDALEVAKLLEQRFCEGKQTFIISNGDFGCRITPKFFIDVLEGRYPESVLKHKELLARYANAQEKIAAEENDTPGLQAVKKAIRQHLGEEQVVITPEMTLMGDLRFNFDDLAEMTRYAEGFLKDIRIETTRRRHPETVTVGEVAAFMDAHLNTAII